MNALTCILSFLLTTFSDTDQVVSKGQSKNNTDSLKQEFTRNAEANVSFSYFGLQNENSESANQFIFHADYTFLKRKSTTSSSTEFEIKYAVGYTKLLDPHWIRDDDLLKIKAKKAKRNKRINLNFSMDFQTALTNGLFPTQRNTFLKTEFAGKSFPSPLIISLYVGYEFKLTSFEQINIGFASIAAKISDKSGIPSHNQKHLAELWKYAITYEPLFTTHLDIDRKICKKINWKNETIFALTWLYSKNSTVSSKNKITYSINKSIKLNLNTNLELNPAIDPKTYLRNTILIGFSYSK